MLLQSLLVAGVLAVGAVDPPSDPVVSVDDAHAVGTAGPVTYAVTVTNPGSGPRVVAVTAQLPDLTVGTASPGGRVAGHQVSWIVRLNAKQVTTVQVSGQATAAARQVGTACVTSRAGDQVYACAVDVDSAAPVVRSAAWWQRWWPPAALLVVAGAVARWWRRQAAAGATAPLTLDQPSGRRQTAIVVGLSLLALLVPAALAVKAVGDRVNGAARARATGAGLVGWQGPNLRTGLAQTVGDDQNDYTVYQLLCQPGDAASTCVAEVAVHNRTTAPQAWYARMQRLVLGDGTWVEADPAATLARNGNRDVFGAGLAPDHTTLVQLEFRVPTLAAVDHLEIRTGAFRNGARVAL